MVLKNTYCRLPLTLNEKKDLNYTHTYISAVTCMCMNSISIIRSAFISFLNEVMFIKLSPISKTQNPKYTNLFKTLTRQSEDKQF